MVADIGVVGLLSLLSTPLLGLGTGLMFCVLLGNDARSPLALKVARWTCRLLGAGIIGLSLLGIATSFVHLAGGELVLSPNLLEPGLTARLRFPITSVPLSA